MSARDLSLVGRGHGQVVLVLQGDTVPEINGQLSALAGREVAEVEERVRHL
ncbi:MAG: hypothetical protein V4550_20885 [Gemmatimonadota bacterium]